MKSISILFLAAMIAAVLPGCGSTPRASVASGTAMGAATGAAVGSFSGNAGRGALLGAGIGALGGVLADEHRRGSFQ